jgi:hypothetical protein
MANIALDIDSYQFLEISKDWLELECLCFLDSALCNKRLRSLFLSNFLFESARYNCPSKQLVNNYFLDWIVVRNLRLNNIILNNCILILCETIKGQSSLNYVSRTVRKVQMAGLDRSTFSYANIFFKSAHHLEHIELVRSNPFRFETSEIISNIAKSCPRLTSYDFTRTKLDESSLLLLSALNVSHININDTNRQEGLVGIRRVISKASERLHTLEMANVGWSWNDTYGLTVDICVEIAKCSSLTVLNISHSEHLTLESFKHVVKGCSHITDLNLEYCKVLLNNDLLDYLSESSLSLRRLHINGGPERSSNVIKRICDSGIHELVTKCRTITDINIGSTDSLTILSLKYLVHNLKLKRLQFRDLRLIEFYKSFELLCASFETLSHFDMQNCCLIGTPKENTILFDALFDEVDDGSGRINPNYISDILQNFPDVLSISVCVGEVRDMTANLMFKHMATLHFNSLIELSVYRVKSSAECLLALSMQCTHVTSLSFHYCSLISDDVVICFLQNCQNIESFSCMLCPLLSGKTLEYLGGFCKKLQKLTFNDCDASFRNFREVVVSCPQLTTLECTYRGSPLKESFLPSVLMDLGRVLSEIICRHEAAPIDLTYL